MGEASHTGGLSGSPMHPTACQKGHMHVCTVVNLDVHKFNVEYLILTTTLGGREF